MYKTIAASCLKEPLPSDSMIIDVRTMPEHEAEALVCSHLHIPLDQLTADRLEKTPGIRPDRPIYLLCKGGVRAREAAKKLENFGFTNLHVIDGGLSACKTCEIQTRIS